MSRRVSGLEACIASLALVLAAARADAADLALVGGNVVTVSGAVIPGGTVLVRGDRIAAVGRDLPIPSGAEVVRCEGKWITPGLVEASTQLGAVEILAIPETVDVAVNRADPIRAAVRMADAINLRSVLIDVARRQGVTSVVTAPSGGLISGQSAWVDLLPAASPSAKTAVISPLAMHATLGEVGAMVVGASRPLALLRMREAFEDARLFLRDRAAYDRNALRQLITSRLDLAALAPVLARRMPMVIDVHRADDIQRVLSLAREERIDVVLHGAEEAWLVAGEIAAAKVPVILNPLSNLPARFEMREARPDNAALLAKAGVRVALTTNSSHNAGSLRFELGNAVRAGLDRDLALAAATLNPAEIFGQGARYGAVAPGKIANLVVWTGDPFEPSSFADVVIIQGARQPLESRQTRLRERYKARLGLGVR